jgi:HAD superfamily hydrolase (TIGR01509 family)
MNKGINVKRTRLKVEGILLDLDGTIVDSKEAYHEAAKIALKTIGQRMINTEIVTEIPKRLELKLPINDLLEGSDAREFLDVYLKTYYQTTPVKTKPLPKISETLKKLSKKAKLALITMRYVPKEKVCGELKKFGLAKYFQYVITALDTNDPKPSPEALIKCAKQLGIQICKCVVVGDSIADIRAGKNAGAKTVGVLSGIFSLNELEKEKPDLILESVNQLPDFLE